MKFGGFGWAPLWKRSQKLHLGIRDQLKPVIDQRRIWQRENPDGWRHEHGIVDLLGLYMDGSPIVDPNKVQDLV